MSEGNNKEVLIKPPGIVEGREQDQKITEDPMIPWPVAEPSSPAPLIKKDGRQSRQHKYRRPLAYVTITSDNIVSLVEIPSGLHVLDIPVGSRPFGIDISPDRQFVYVSNRNDATLSVISTRSNRVVHTVDLNTASFSSAAPFGVKVSPNGRWIYVANETTHNM